MNSSRNWNSLRDAAPASRRSSRRWRNGSPPVEFEFDEDHSYFMVRLPIHPAALEVAEFAVAGTMNASKVGADETANLPGTESGLESGESGLESATSRSVLQVLAASTLGRSGIARKLGHEKVSGAINRAIKELLEKDLIAYTLPEKPNSRLQQYRLTEKGRTVPVWPIQRPAMSYPSYPHRRRNPFRQTSSNGWKRLRANARPILVSTPVQRSRTRLLVLGPMRRTTGASSSASLIA